MLSRSDNPTLIDLLKHAAEENPGGLCLSMDGIKCSFSDLYQGALKRAECFTNLGAQMEIKLAFSYQTVLNT